MGERKRNVVEEERGNGRGQKLRFPWDVAGEITKREKFSTMSAKFSFDDCSWFRRSYERSHYRSYICWISQWMAFRRDDAWNLWFRIETTISFGKQYNSYPAICVVRMSLTIMNFDARYAFYATLIIVDFREELHIHSNVLAYN